MKHTEANGSSLKLIGERLILRRLTPRDATQRYLSWMSDPEVTSMLESRFVRFTIDSLVEYINAMNSSTENLFLAIVEKDTNKHVGNIKLGPIHPVHRHGDIGIIIGDKQCWGKGYAQEAIQLISDYALNVLELHKVTAGCYSNNIGSLKAFERAGFTNEGTLKSHYRCGEEWVDRIQLARWRSSPESWREY